LTARHGTGQAAITMLHGSRPVAVFAVADAVREESRAAIQRLQEQRKKW
jgi:cation transport ATPase